MSERARDVERGADDIPDEDRGATDVPEETNHDAVDPVDDQPEMTDDASGSGLPIGAVFRSGS